MSNLTYEKKYGKGPHVSVDVVLFHNERVLLIQRKDGQWALPGGFVEPDEELYQAARRELMEETAIQEYFQDVEPRTYSRVDRDHRSRIITFAFSRDLRTDKADWAVDNQTQAGSDAHDAKWFLLREAYKFSLYADHNQILVDAVVARKK